jgi:hypothetical protein
MLTPLFVLKMYSLGMRVLPYAIDAGTREVARLRVEGKTKELLGLPAVAESYLGQRARR